MAFPTTNVIRDFGCTAANPSVVLTGATTLQLFDQPASVPGAGINGPITPPQWSPFGTPQGFANLGYKQMPGQLLVAPNTGSLNGKVYNIAAAGSIVMPSSAVNTTFNLVMSQNYFTQGQPVQSDTLFVLTNPISVAASSTTNWSLTATLAGNGIGTPALASAGILIAGGQQYVGNGFSNSRVANTEPIIQLSLGIMFGGSSGGNSFQATLTQFQMLWVVP